MSREIRHIDEHAEHIEREKSSIFMNLTNFKSILATPLVVHEFIAQRQALSRLSEYSTDVVNGRVNRISQDTYLGRRGMHRCRQSKIRWSSLESHHNQIACQKDGPIVRWCESLIDETWWKKVLAVWSTADIIIVVHAKKIDAILSLKLYVSEAHLRIR